MAIDYQQINRDFNERLHLMADLVAKGRGIEILLRIADQTKKGLESVDTYEQMLGSKLDIPNSHPPQAMSNLFKGSPDRKRLELARDISDKLAHGIYRTGRKLINKYKDRYGLKTELNNNPLSGWKGHMSGHLIDDNGKRIDTIIDLLKSTNKNLIVEEFDVFVHNNYHLAAEEIFKDAWEKILIGEKSLSSMSAKLHMLRGLRRGEKTYIEDSD